MTAALWTGGMAALCALRPKHVAPWTSAGGGVVVIAPHPDDEVLGSGASILRHRAAGEDVHVVFVTDGSASRAGGRAPGDMARARRAEADASCALLGVSGSIWLGWDERRLLAAAPAPGELAALGALLHQVVISLAPRMVYGPSLVDFHPVHVRVARALAADIGPTTLVRLVQVQVPLTSALVNVVAPVAPYEEQVDTALAAYETQAAAIASARRLRSYSGARYGAGGPAEAFWELSGRELRALCAGRAPRARGLRGHALTDPLAYAVGRGERVALLRRTGWGELARPSVEEHPEGRHQ